MLSDKLLSETEQRYASRTQVRQENQAKIEASNLLSANPPELVERRLRRLAVAPTEGPPPGTRAILGEQPQGFDPAFERFIGNNDLLGVAYLELAARAARAVCCVRVWLPGGRRGGSGTGFMVSPRLLLTNNHVLADVQTAALSEVQFDYQSGIDGRLVPAVSFDFEPASFFVTDEALDYTLVAVAETSRDGKTPLRSFGWLPLLADDANVLTGESLNIIQHPNGEPKQIALRANELVDMLQLFLHYHTDTAPGSSGSPVFNDQWEVVALHHSGVPRRDEQGRVLARDGRLWTEDMGEQWVDWIANEGVRISRIVTHLQGQHLSGAADALRRELLAGEIAAGAVRPASGLSETTSGAPDNSTPTPPAGLAFSTTGEGVTWTIPLRLTVQFGQPVVDMGTAQPQTASLRPATPAQPAAQQAAPEPASLRAALAELARAPERPYYDEEKDACERLSYYGDLPGERSPAELFEALHELVERTGTNMARYSPSEQVYPWVDLQPNLKLRSVYSGLEYEPERIIREDFAISQERALRASELMLAEAALSPEELAEELSALEAALPYNCEHVVPQSWFRKKEPMKGDLHHLFACESNCNSFRGNIPYFDFPDFEEVVRTDCGKREVERFEPGAGKGEVARATLYFLIRYPRLINSTIQSYDKDRLKTILAWHAAHPVTLHERHRNMAIYEKQGNRNPLIDFPEWAEKIDFEIGL